MLQFIQRARRRVGQAFDNLLDLWATVYEWHEGTTAQQARPPQQSRHQPYYDTYRSWIDSDTGEFRLFTDTAHHERRVCNMDCPGSFPEGQTFMITAVKVQVDASSVRLKTLVERGTTVTVEVGNRYYLEEVAESFRDGLQLKRTIRLRGREAFAVRLNFSGDVVEELQRIRTRVGPGSGWFQVRVTLDGVQTRPAF